MPSWRYFRRQDPTLCNRQRTEQNDGATKQRFPADLDYAVVLDTTRAVTEGMKETVTTLLEAMVLVIIVVFLFLQNWRATLIPVIAVPVSLHRNLCRLSAVGILDKHVVLVRVWSSR